MPTTHQEIAFINPVLLQWALEQSRVSPAHFAKQLRISDAELENWLAGKARPPFNKAEEAATLLRIPFGYLFLKTPPNVALPIPDFRERSKGAPSFDLRELISDVLCKQEWYVNERDLSGMKRLAFVGGFSIKSDPVKVASDICRVLNVNGATRRRAAGRSAYLRQLSKNAEESGLLVLRSSVVGNDQNRRLSPAEFRGFAMVNEVAPAIFINTADYVSAQVFTFAHELAHVWIGQSGVSNPDETAPDANAIESFCNKVAAEVLVPSQQFVPIWLNHSLAGTADHFRVSTLVILRRAHELGRISKADFIRLLEEEREKVTPRSDDAGGGPDYYRLVTARMGYRLTHAVLRDVNAQKLAYREAAALLNVSLSSLATFAAMER